MLALLPASTRDGAKRCGAGLDPATGAQSPTTAACSPLQQGGIRVFPGGPTHDLD